VVAPFATVLRLFNLLHQGLTIKQVATRLGLHPHTVEVYIWRPEERFQADNIGDIADSNLVGANERRSLNCLVLCGQFEGGLALSNFSYGGKVFDVPAQYILYSPQ
jgi:hypothetical protein